MYSDLIVYQKSKKLTTSVYLLTNSFPKSEVHGLSSQIRRAVVSIPLNISEGSARNTNKQFNNFLNIAIGSTTEVKVCLEISLDLKYITQEEFNKIFPQVEEVSKMLYSLKRSID